MDGFINVFDYMTSTQKDGVTGVTAPVDVTTPVQNAINDSTGNVVFFPSGTYLITSEMTWTLSNCTIAGVGDSTIITGSFGHALIKLGAIDNVTIKDFFFYNTYENSSANDNKAIVYTNNTDIIDLTITRCKFSGPLVNVAALIFFIRKTSTDTTAVMDGCTVSDCNFVDIGGICCGPSNRGEATDKYNAARRFYFLRNRSANSGLLSAAGFMLSLDGYGKDFYVCGNDIRNARTIGIENTGWINGEISGNRFSEFSSDSARQCAPMSMSGHTMTGCLIQNNVCDEDATTKTLFANTNDCTFMGNIWKSKATTDSALTISGDNNRVFGDICRSSGNYGCEIIGQNNILENCTFDTSSSSSNYSCLEFGGGSSTMYNQAKGARFIKGSGGYLVGQSSGATENVVWDFQQTILDNKYAYVVTTISGTPSLYKMSGEDAILSYDAIRFIGTLSSGWTIEFPRAVFVKPKRIWNATTQILSFKTTSGGVGGTLAAGGYGTLVYDFALGSLRVLG